MAFLVLLIATAIAPGQMTLTLSDGTTTRGSLAGIGPQGAFAWRGASGPMTFPASKVVSVESAEAMPAQAEGGFRLDLRSGDVLYGRLEDGSADDVRISNPAFRDATVALDDLAAIWNLAFPFAPESLPPAVGNAETLYKDQDGRPDRSPGTLERLAKNHVVFTSAAGKNRTFTFDRDRIIAVRFSAAARPTGNAAAIVHLRDGSRLSGTLAPGDGASVAIKLVIGPALVVDPRAIKSISLNSEGLRYLSDLDPAEFVETPLFAGAVAQGLKRDRGLRSGQMLMIARQTFTKGLLIPAHGRVRYALDGSFARFSAAVGADPALSSRDVAGSVKASIEVDGKPAWTSKVLRAGQPPEAVEIPLSGAKDLVIQVDFADSFDAGARAVFGNAMLIR